ncbi:minor tail protein [Microbacterium phage Smarties]|uniref:Minor tail protein n=1 Tax=Microbacterium phage Ariadne TaxID=2656546 RepID=A0A649VBF2_9CAUD|nr:minor tail protein [Microbacterium phage Ariadne]QGJ89449.1 minor tail protein [Microbacterium phage Ariadne]QGJ91436.1 minor tail protein [Microbacterium phage Smarties]
MLDEYLALGGVELGNNARALAYSRCLPCCAGLLKGGACDGIHDATNPFTNAVYEWQVQAVNQATNPVPVVGAEGAAVAGWTGVTSQGGVAQNSANDFLTANVATVVGEEVSVAVVLTSEADTTITLALRETLGGAFGAQPIIDTDTVDLDAGVPTLVALGGTVTGATSNGFRLVVSTVLVGQITVGNTIIQRGTSTPDSWFSGSTLPAGSNPTLNRVSWAGAENASASTWESNVVVSPAESAEPPYSCNDIQRAPWYDPNNEFSQGLAGFYLLRVSGITDSTSTATITEGIDNGGVIGASRHATRSVRVRTMILGCGNGAAEYGLAWLKAALGEQFCARHGDACGTSDLEFFIDCPPALNSSDPNYGSTTARYRRYLHGVGMTSGPIIAEEYETPSGAYVIVVEYILTAESPFVWGETIPVAATGDVLTAYDDIPFNLMRHPNAEVGDGIPAVTATQYVFNGSVEYGATGWANAVTNIPAGITAGASTDIAAVGPNSYRVRLLATAAVANGSIDSYYDVALGALPAGSKPSLSLWAAALIFGGAPTLDPTLTAEVEWRNGATIVGTTALGTIPINGGNASALGLTIPAGATTARMRVRASNITAAAADDLRLYADAFSLTVP